MRKIHILVLTPWLLLAPALAAATTYKCVVDGKTTYSQETCGKNAEEVHAKGKLSGVTQPTPAGPGLDTRARSTPAPAAKETSDAKRAEPAANDCQSRLAAYRESEACFGRYRINANVMDPAAYKNCKTVAEPTDCLAGTAQ